MTKRKQPAAPEIVRRDGALAPASYNERDNTVELVWTTGAVVRRRSWSDGPFDEELIVEPGAIRTQRLNGGAPLLDGHRSDGVADIVGVVVPGSVRIANGIGTARVRLSDAPDVASAAQKIREGVARSISVGYRVHSVERIARDNDAPLHRVTDWEPLELSVVAIPADAGAQVRADPGAHPLHHRLQEVAVGANDQNVTIEAEIEQRAERTRASTIADLASRTGLAEFGAEHVRAGTPVDRFRTLLLDKLVDQERAQHPGGPQQQTGAPLHAQAIDNRRDDARARAIENALLHRSDPQRFPLERGSEPFVAVPLLEIARSAIEARGTRTAGMSKMAIAAEALTPRGLHSSSDFPNVLANVANKTLRAGYEAYPATWRPLVRVTTVPDFKSVSRVQLGEAPRLDRVNEHGEFKRGTIAEAGETYRIATYGKVVGVTRQTIINDDLDALTRVPQAFGVQAAQLESDIVWAQLLGTSIMGDGLPLFDAAHKNLLDGAAIGETAVSAARLAMALQRGLDGETVLNVSPAFLIVPKAQETAALRFLTQITPAKVDDAVPVELRRMQVISEPRLDVGIPRFGIAGDANAFFFAAQPGAGVDVIELAYLEGATGVYIETRAGFDVDGVEIKCRMDAGAKMLDWRGVSKNPGATSGD